MAAERDRTTTADYVITSASPVLIMLMVGSLVFFLIEVLYAGQYSGRLLYTMFFFVMGAVLVARIAIQYDAARATLYGAGLGICVYIALISYVEYPKGSLLRSIGWLVNLGLMALVWWSAHKLTWDCTNLDSNREASGRGLLSAVGLDADDAASARRKPAASAEDVIEEKEGDKRDRGIGAWFARLLKYRERRRKAPHTPGVWVVYFALAALPLFGLGQSLISLADDDRRWTVFVLMIVYVGSALALLVTTSLVGLRKYLRQRRARMPTAITASWLGLGAVVIAAFLLVGAFLPRPHSEVPWFGLARVGSTEREASKYSQVKQGGSGKGNEQGSGEGKEGDANAESDGKGDQSSGGRGGRGKGGRDGKEDNGGKGEEGKTGGSSSDSPPRSPSVRSPLEAISSFLKWVAFALVALLVLAASAYFVLRHLAPFTGWARRLLESLRNWWESLFSREKQQKGELMNSTAPMPIPRLPFSAFSNPFEDGSAGRRQPGELIGYTFAALDAWAGDRENDREATETPLEFAARLGKEYPALEDASQRLALLYVRVAYSHGAVPADAARVLEEAWDQLQHGIIEAVPVVGA